VERPPYLHIGHVLKKHSTSLAFMSELTTAHTHLNLNVMCILHLLDHWFTDSILLCTVQVRRAMMSTLQSMYHLSFLTSQPHRQGNLATFWQDSIVQRNIKWSLVHHISKMTEGHCWTRGPRGEHWCICLSSSSNWHTVTGVRNSHASCRTLCQQMKIMMLHVKIWKGWLGWQLYVYCHLCLFFHLLNQTLFISYF